MPVLLRKAVRSGSVRMDSSPKPQQEAHELQPWEECAALPLARMFHLWYTHKVKLIAQLKLQPTPEQADALLRTLETANEACDCISRIAFSSKTFNKFDLQKICYADVRQTFALTAQMVIRLLAKVGDAYKLDRRVCRTFRPHGSIAYDDRILSYALKDSSVSIWTLDGRQCIPFVCGERQRQLLHTRKGETDLVFVRGEWYLLAVCDVEEPEPSDVEGVLGIEGGVTNIATDNDGTIHQGKALKNVRYRHRRLRNKLQLKRTHGSRRRLRKLAGQERRFATWVNHTLSKRIGRLRPNARNGRLPLKTSSTLARG